MVGDTCRSSVLRIHNSDFPGGPVVMQWREHWFDPGSGKIPHAAKQLSTHAMTIEHMGQNPWAAGEKPPQWEATTMRSPHNATKSSPRACLLQVEKVKVKSLSRVWLFVTPWTVAHQAPLSMGFSRQEYWSGLPFPSPGDLPNPGIEPGSPTL